MAHGWDPGTKPEAGELDAAVRRQLAAQYQADGTLRVNSSVLSKAWGVPQKDVKAAARSAARDFDPAAVPKQMTPEQRADMVASDAPVQQPPASS